MEKNYFIIYEAENYISTFYAYGNNLEEAISLLKNLRVKLVDILSIILLDNYRIKNDFINYDKELQKVKDIIISIKIKNEK